MMGAARAGLAGGPFLALILSGTKLVCMVVWLFWMYLQWKRLPTHLQVVSGLGVTPAQAALRNAIPVYCVYWMFAVNAALCDGINEVLAKKKRPRAAPVMLSLASPAAVLAMAALPRFLDATAYATVYACSVVIWSAYMLGVERAFVLAKQKG
jgi:hypothetical protein